MTGYDVSALPTQARGFQGQPAGLISRALAMLFDAVGVATIVLVGYAGVSAALFAWHARSFSFPTPSGSLTLAVAGAVATGYLTISWWIAGRTYGCAVMGLRVIGRHDRDVRFTAALIRAVLCLVFPLGLGWCAVDRRARAVHDLVTGTRVIYDWRHQVR